MTPAKKIEVETDMHVLVKTLLELFKEKGVLSAASITLDNEEKYILINDGQFGIWVRDNGGIMGYYRGWMHTFFFKSGNDYFFDDKETYNHVRDEIIRGIAKLRTNRLKNCKVGEIKFQMTEYVPQPLTTLDWSKIKPETIKRVQEMWEEINNPKKENLC